MFYNPMKPEKLIESEDKERQMISILENNNSHLKIASLKKNYEIEPHMSHTDVCLYIIEGELEITFTHAADCTCTACSCALPKEKNNETKSFKVKKGELFIFGKNTVHSVKAEKDSLFFITKI